MRRKEKPFDPKAIFLDMDGTIADLYGVPDWLNLLRSYDPSPYIQARPLVDMEQLKKKLAECLESPRMEANKLSRMPDCYKIKLKSSGYRLAYQVIDDRVVVFVVAVGKRERSEVNSAASRHLS